MEPETVAHVADESAESNCSDLLPHYTSRLPAAVVTHQKCCAYSCLSHFTASEIDTNHLICGKQVYIYAF